MPNRSACKFPDHHGAVRSAGSAVLAVVAVLAGLVVLVAVRFVMAYFWWFAVPSAVAVALRLGLAAVRFARLDRAGKRHWFLCRWHRLGWKRLARNLQLAPQDKHLGGADSSRPPKVNYPKARFRPDSSGMVVAVKTVHGVGREQVEAVSGHLADAWKCRRVAVAQVRPGRILVRAMRHDPLLEPLTLEDGPSADLPHRVWLGRDEHGQDRWLDLRNLAGICVGGQPGGGKSQAITSWETQLAPSPCVQFVNVDGKGAGEFDDFDDRAWITAGDSIGGMLAVLEMLTGLMYDRLGTVRDFTGGRKNIWSVGVSEVWPLQFSVFDETQSFFDMPAAKALGKDAEKACAQAIKLGGELVRKGRSVGMCSVFATQKPTTDSLPSSISSNCALSVAFSLKTSDAAKATLGADIGDYPSLSPVTLSLPDYCGVAVVSLRDGMAPFTRLRSPMVTEDQAADVVAASAQLRKDPRGLLPVAVPDDARELVR